VPSISIDTFFACSLLVSVALISTAFFAGTMQSQINSMQDLNQQDYLRAVADHLVSNCGTPLDWGASGQIPSTFGLSSNDSNIPFELDIDKVSRLSTENSFALTYPQISIASGLNKIAFGVSVSSIMSIHIQLFDNRTVGDLTNYSFQIEVNGDGGPITADLSCYVLGSNYSTHIINITSSDGIGQIGFSAPNSEKDSLLILVFARSTEDERITAFEGCHLSQFSSEPSNETLFEISLKDYNLNVYPKNMDTTVENVQAFSYSYNSSLALTTGLGYVVPKFLDRSPIVVVVQGSQSGTDVLDWTPYPQVPLSAGANFANSETNVYVYYVTINGALYKLTLRLGDVIK
jgi:hypothetical protein